MGTMVHAVTASPPPNITIVQAVTSNFNTYFSSFYHTECIKLFILTEEVEGEEEEEEEMEEGDLVPATGATAHAQHPHNKP